ncbi:MAG: S8 family serine peptidase [Pseudomonadota bacterium]
MTIRRPNALIALNSRFDGPVVGFPQRVSSFALRLPGDVAMLLGAARAHRLGITGQGIRVAMIDTGLDASHPHYVEYGYRVSVELAPGAADPEKDEVGHGTAEAACLLAVAPDAEVTMIKVAGINESMVGATLLGALERARDLQPHVVSISVAHDLRSEGSDRPLDHQLSLPSNLEPEAAVIREMVAAGIPVVASAGNGQAAFPGMMPEVISAGGVFVSFNGSMMASDYASAYESRVFPGRHVPDLSGLCGPDNALIERGRYILLPCPPGSKLDANGADGTAQGEGWALASGTSAAAPQIAGAVALLLARKPDLTPAAVRDLLMSTARPVTAGRGNPASNEGTPLEAPAAAGAGLLNVWAALQQL